MKKNKLPSLVAIIILTLLTSIVWVSLSIYRAFTAKPDVVVPDEISKPITATLDQTTIQKIESGIYFNSSQVPDDVVTVSVSPLPAPIPIAIPAASPSAAPAASPSAAPTGP
jgi:hypothetical protein